MGYVHDIDPVMVSVLGVRAYWYGFAYTFGFSGLILWLWRHRSDLGWNAAQVIDASIVFIVAILIGARSFNVVVYEWDWYRDRPAEVLMLWKGGMASHGVLLGAVVGALLISAMTKTELLRLLDALVVPAAFLLGLSRIGNFIEGGVIGTVTDLPWGVVLADVDGFRHPVSLYDGLKNLLLVPLLVGVLRAWPAGAGVGTAVFLIGYGALRFVVDQFRDYESTLWGLGPGQWFNLAMAAAGILLILVCMRQAAPRCPPAPARRSSGVTSLLRQRFLRILLLVLLVVFPLSIPTSWTTEHLQSKRQAQSLAPR
jgi:phosphatidylglycerol---prolipoprotein diacylglyceryl transferase